MNLHRLLVFTCCVGIACATAKGADRPHKAQRVRPVKVRRESSGAKATIPTLTDRPVLPTMPAPPANEPGPDYHHASTWQQGYLDGLARLLRAEGITAYNMALAAILVESARDAAIRNEILWLDARNIQRLKHRGYRAMMRGPSITHEEAVRLARRRAPKQLSMTQLDRVNGRIAWPADLRGEQFAADRQLLTEIFHEATVRNEAVPYAEVKQATNRMLSQLREQITELPTSRYSAAKGFIKGLDLAARKTVVSIQLASDWAADPDTLHRSQ